MVLSISVNYVGGLLAGQRDRPRLAWAGLLFAVCAGLGLLAWFKYAGFLARTICGLGFAVPIPQVTLPCMWPCSPSWWPAPSCGTPP